MSEQILIADLLLGVDVARPADALIDRAIVDVQRRVSQKKVNVDLSFAGNAGAAPIRIISDELKRMGQVGVAAYREQAAAARALKAENDAVTASMRAQGAQLGISSRLAAKAASDATAAGRALGSLQSRTATIRLAISGVPEATRELNKVKTLLTDLKMNSQYRIAVDVTALTAVNSQINTQIVQLQSLITQLRALGAGPRPPGPGPTPPGGGAGAGAGGGLPADVQKTLREVERLNNLWTRGKISAENYNNGLTAMQGRLQTAAAAATRGSAEFARIDAGITKITVSLRGINTDNLQRVKTDAGAMRLAFDQATSGVARNSQAFRDAAASYGTASTALQARLTALVATARLTPRELASVNAELRRLAAEANSVSGSINHAGMSGGVANALGAGSGLLAQSGGFGAAALGGAALVKTLKDVYATSGPAALGIGAIGVAAAGVTVGLVALGSVGLTEVKKLEKGLNILQANGVEDLKGVETQIDALKGSLGQVGETFTRGDIALATADIVKAGVSSDDAMKLLASSTRLASAEQINLNDASALLLKNIRQYDLTLSDAARAGDMLAKAGNLAAGTANDLSIGLGIVGGTGKQAKIEMFDLLGMLVELDNKGMSAADVGANGLRAAIASLGDVTKKGTGVLSKLGIEINDVEGKARPAGDILVELGAKMRSMGIVADKTTGLLSGNGEALRTVASIMDNRAAAAVLNLSGGWKTYGDQIRNSSGELVRYSTTMQQGVEPAMIRLKTAFADAGGAFAKTFAGPLASFLTETLTPMVTGLGTLFEKISAMKDTGVITLGLKFEAGDSGTEKMLKILGVTLGVPFAVGAQLSQAANVENVRLALIRGGMLQGNVGPLEATRQSTEIAANYEKYFKMMTDANIKFVEGQTNPTGPLADKPLPPGTAAQIADAFFKAIYAQESKSSGGYSAFNTDWSQKGQGAVGKYQMMPFNLIDESSYKLPQSQRGAYARANMNTTGKAGFGWDFKATGKDYTLQQILDSPEIQEKIGQYKLNEYLTEELKKNNGNVELAVKAAASRWYGTGSTNGPSTQAYAGSVFNKFRANMPQSPLAGAGPLLPGQERAMNTGVAALNVGILNAIQGETGDKEADTVAGWCARWVRMMLVKAAPEAQQEIEKMFAGNADQISNRMETSPLLQRDMSQLKPGDVVIYDSHIGVYLGKGPDGQDMVRGNNLWGQKNGRSVVSDERMTALGKPQGFVRVGDVPGVLDGVDAAAAPVTVAKVKVASDKLLKEGRRILAAIAKATKGGDVDGKIAADAVLKAFEDSGPRAVAALEIVRGEIKKTAKEVSEFGQGYDKLNDQMDTAASYYKLNEGAASYLKSLKSVQSGAEAAAAAELKAFGKTDKYQALLKLAGDAAEKTRGIQKQADSDATTRGNTRLQQQQALNKALADENEGDARRALEALKVNQAQELALAKDNASEKAKIIEATGPAILAGENRLANQKRDRLVKEAGAAMREANKLPGADKTVNDQTRRTLVSEAYKEAAAARAKALVDQKNAEQDAGRSAAEFEAQLADELAGLQIEKAQQTAARLQAIEDAKIKAQEKNLQKQLELTRTYSQAQFDRTEAIARATLKRATTGAAGKPNEQAIVDTATSAYLTTVSTARLARAQAVSTAQDALKKGLSAEEAAVDTLTERYNSLRTSLQERAKAGTLTSQDLIDYARNLGLVWKDAGAAGVKGRAEITQAHAAAKAFATTAKGINETALSNLAEQATYLAGVQATLESLPNMTKEGLIEVYSEARAKRDLALIDGVQKEWARRRAQEDAEQLVVYQMQADGNLQGATTARDRAVELADAGNAAGGVELLQKELDSLMDAAARGEDASDAINLVIDTINALLDTTAQADTELRSLYGLQAEGNLAAAEAIKTQAQELASAGDKAGAVELLEKELSSLMDAAERGEDASDAINLVIDMINTLSDTTSDVDAEMRSIYQLQADANLALAQSAKTASDELASAGDSDGALAVLESRLSEVMDAAERGEDAADAINLLVEAINGLTGSQGLTDEFNSFVAGLEGTVSDQIDTVATRLEEITDPAMRAKLKGLLADLRGQLPSYESPSAAGYTPGANGFSNQSSGDLTPGIAQARDLGTKIGNTVNPAALQGLMAEAAELLAGEIGANLPDAVRQALEDAVSGAQGYITVLQDITGETITDSWERAWQNVSPPPPSEYTGWLDRLFEAGTTGAQNPVQHSAMVESLNAARLAGELTEEQLQNLLNLWQEFTDYTPNLMETMGLGEWQTQIQTLTDEFDHGRLTAEEYAAALQSSAVDLNALADEAQRMGNIPLADRFRELAVSLRALTPEVAATLKVLGKVQEYAGYVQQLAGAFADLFEAMAPGNEQMADIGANLRGAENLAGKVVALAGDIARIVANPADIGAWVGAITKVISGIAEAIGGFQRAKAEAKKLQEDFNKQFTLINGDDYAKTTIRSRGWLADTFGGGPEVKQTINELGLKLARTLEESIISGIKGGFKESLKTKNFGDFKRVLRESTYAGVLDGVIEAFFDKTLTTILGPAIKAYTDALETPDTADDEVALAGIDTAISRTEGIAEKYQQNVAPKLATFRTRLGLGDDGTVDNRNTSTIGAAPTLQTGIPTAVLGIPPELSAALRNLTQWDIGLQNRANQRLIDLADYVLSQPRTATGGAPPLTGLGTL